MHLRFADGYELGKPEDKKYLQLLRKEGAVGITIKGKFVSSGGPFGPEGDPYEFRISSVVEVRKLSKDYRQRFHIGSGKTNISTQSTTGCLLLVSHPDFDRSLPICFQHVVDSCTLCTRDPLFSTHYTLFYQKHPGVGGTNLGGYKPGPDKIDRIVANSDQGKRLESTGQLVCGYYEVIVAASADDAKSTPEDASGIAAPRVVAHSAGNLRNTGSALRAK
jgi:hypothetical protein